MTDRRQTDVAVYLKLMRNACMSCYKNNRMFRRIVHSVHNDSRVAHTRSQCAWADRRRFCPKCR